MATSAGSDLEVIEPDGDAAHEPELRPHPLGMRDVIDVLAAAGRYALIGAAVCLAAVLGFVVGQANRPLEVNRSPISATGVLWACAGTMAGTVHVSGLPPGAVEVELKIGQHVMAGSDWPNFGAAGSPTHFAVAAGEIHTDVQLPDPGGGPQISLEAQSVDGRVVLKTTILRVPCSGLEP